MTHDPVVSVDAARKAGERAYVWGELDLEERKKASICHFLGQSTNGASAHVELDLDVRVERVYREVLPEDAVEPEEELLRRIRPAAQPNHPTIDSADSESAGRRYGRITMIILGHSGGQKRIMHPNLPSPVNPTHRQYLPGPTEMLSGRRAGCPQGGGCRAGWRKPVGRQGGKGVRGGGLRQLAFVRGRGGFRWVRRRTRGRCSPLVSW
jgi:hypothetical protein